MKKLMVFGVLILVCLMYFPSFAGAEKVIKLRFSVSVPEGWNQAICAKKFKEIVEERTNRRVQIDIFLSGQLGEEHAVIESVIVGAIDMSCTNIGGSGQIFKELTVLNIPAMFPPDRKVIEKVFVSDVMNKLIESAEKKGVKSLCPFFEQFNQITSNRPIYKPEDMKGLKIRVMNSPILIALYKALGSNPMPLAFGELYSGLQQGLVEAQENPYDVIYGFKLYEVQKYVISTNHGITSDFTWINKKVFENLPTDIQKIFIEAGIETQKYMFESQGKLGEVMREKLLKTGIKECIPSPELNESFKKASKITRGQYIKLVGEKRGKMILKLIDDAITKSSK